MMVRAFIRRAVLVAGLSYAPYWVTLRAVELMASGPPHSGNRLLNKFRSPQYFTMRLWNVASLDLRQPQQHVSTVFQLQQFACQKPSLLTRIFGPLSSPA